MSGMNCCVLKIITVFWIGHLAWAGGHGGSGQIGAVGADGQVLPLDIIRTPGRVPYRVFDTEAGKKLKAKLSQGVYQKLTYFSMRVDEQQGARTSSVRSFGDQLVWAIDNLRFYLVPGPLPETHDVNFVSLHLDFQGRQVQVARQDYFGNVELDRDLFLSMNQDLQVNENLQQVVFTHEALISMYTATNGVAPLYTDQIMDLVHYMNSSDQKIPVTAVGLSESACIARLPVLAGVYKNLKLIDDPANSKMPFVAKKYFVVSFSQASYVERDPLSSPLNRCRVDYFVSQDSHYVFDQRHEFYPSAVNSYHVLGYWNQNREPGYWRLYEQEENDKVTLDDYPRLLFKVGQHEPRGDSVLAREVQSPYEPRRLYGGAMAIFRQQ